MGKFRHRGVGAHGRKPPFIGAVWMIGMGFLLLTHQVWPGILILIGISIVMSSLWKNNAEPDAFNQPSLFPPPDPFTRMNHEPVAPDPAQYRGVSSPINQPPINPTPATQNSNTGSRSALRVCPHCGAPVHSDEIKSNDISPRRSACSYCGSTL